MTQERYYFKTTGDEIDTDCIEPCQIKKGIMIGSAACQVCEHCVNSNATSYECTWIVCEKLNEAIKPKIYDTGKQHEQ